MQRKSSIEEEKEKQKMKTIEKAKLAKRSESVQQTQAEMNGRPIYTEMDAEFFGLNNGNTVGNSTKKQDSLFSK